MPSSLDKSNEFFSTLEGFNYTGTIQASFGSCEAVRFSSFINVVNAVIQCLGSAYFSAYVIRCSLIFIFFLFIYFIFGYFLWILWSDIIKMMIMMMMLLLMMMMMMMMIY